MPSTLQRLLETQLGSRRAADLLAAVAVPEALAGGDGDLASRAELAFALDLLLFADLLRRTPSAEAYVLDRTRAGGRVCFDHGALRTVAAPSGALPEGRAALARVLEPLGYRVADTYPLDRLALTGRAYCHQDLPEDVPQFFLSEFHPERFTPAFQDAVARVLAGARDPLGPAALGRLDRLGADRVLPLAEAAALLPDLAACFDRQHPVPSYADYRILVAESAEMAWICTEGAVFNHATDRVPDVRALALAQQALGRPMKDVVEVSASGRVLQTAYRADPVRRPFLDAAGRVQMAEVPGSFFEFITRHPLPGGGLDLTFDTGNAQAIFRMTAGEA